LLEVILNPSILEKYERKLLKELYMKIIAMIPARLGSQRVPKKNLRLMNGKPLISYSIEAAKKAGCFDEIYVNSEADIFGEIAADLAVRFYKRPAEFAANSSINDEFALDFVRNVQGDLLVQILPTSPLITSEEILGFVNETINGNWDTMVSVTPHQIACVYEGKPINFKFMEPHRSSQTMVPVQSYATVLMAWRYKSFLDHMTRLGYAYHGADGRTGYFPIRGLSTIDIDNEEDFVLAEVAIAHREMSVSATPKYYAGSSNSKQRAEIDVPSILRNDGVEEHDFSKENLPQVNLNEIINSKDNSRSWSHRLVNTENNSATLISQLPGEGNRLHHHNDWNEWWYIVKGEWIWEIEGEKLLVKQGDVVFIEKNKWHKITASGNTPAIRLAVSKDKVAHIYKEY
jgi:CMP-N-acetylneuraminic acid synthetase/quercetin dioxygenase-like cupin family protein